MKFKDITTKHSADTGMALVLICLLLANIIIKSPPLNYIAIILLVITMGAPIMFKPAALVWFSISHLLSAIFSRIFLSIIFYFVVTPVGILMNLFRDDPLNIRAFKASNVSVFKKRNHLFTKADIDNPF